MSLFPFRVRRMRVRLMQVGAAFVAATMIAGCGSNYRPVVTPISPNGPSAQPQSLAVVVSSPSPTAPGVATVIDYAGDTVLVQAQIGPGPLDFTLSESGSVGYTVNSDGTLTNFPVSQTDPQEKHITYSTLPTTAQVVGLFSPAAGLWAADQTGNNIDVLTGGTGGAETYKLSVPVASTPVIVTGGSFGGQHEYALSMNNSTTPAGSVVAYDDMTCNTTPSTIAQTGEADSVEVATYTVSARIPLQKCPVYAIQSTDNRRFFVLNRGSDTVSVINSQLNTLDTGCAPPTGCTNQNGQLYFTHPVLPLSTTALTATGVTPPNCNLAVDPTCGGMTTTAGPVYAEYNSTTSQLVVANYDGGTISIIDVSLDQYGNDSPTFGTTYTVHVGNTATPYPAAVTVLNDGTRAYTANQGDDSGSGNGTVSIVNLSSHTVEKTLSVVGHPRTVVSTQNSLYGKVYVAAPDTPYVTIVRTDQDIVDTTVLVEGNVVDVRVTTQNASGGNANVTSRRPGAGQPCYLPPALETATYGANPTLADCQTQP
jgi:hypothetical protein